MSISSSSSWSPNLVQVNPKAPFNSVPKVLLGPIFSYLVGDEKDDWNANVEPNSILAIDRVCKQWQSHPALQALKNGRENRISQQYLPTFREGFAQSKMKISQLPIFDLKGRTGETGYIDFIKPKDMPHAVMRFKDMWERPGLALKVRTDANVIERQERAALQRELADFFQKPRPTALMEVLSSIMNYLKGFTDADTELVFFQRYTDDKTSWRRVGGKNGMTEIAEERFEQASVPGQLGPFYSAPFNSATINPTFLSDLLQGKDSFFTLPGFNGMSEEPARARKTLQIQAFLITALAALLISFIVPHQLDTEEI